MSGRNLSRRISILLMVCLCTMTSCINANGYFKCTNNVKLIKVTECTQGCEATERQLNSTESMPDEIPNNVTTSGINDTPTTSTFPTTKVVGFTPWLGTNGNYGTNKTEEAFTVPQQSTFLDALSNVVTEYSSRITNANANTRMTTTRQESTDHNAATTKTYSTTQNGGTMTNWWFSPDPNTMKLKYSTEETSTSKNNDATRINLTATKKLITKDFLTTKDVVSKFQTETSSQLTNEKDTTEGIKTTYRTGNTLSAIYTLTSKDRILYGNTKIAKHNPNTSDSHTTEGNSTTPYTHTTENNIITTDTDTLNHNLTSVDTKITEHNPTTIDTPTTQHNPTNTTEQDPIAEFDTHTTKHKSASLDTFTTELSPTTLDTNTKEHNTSTEGILSTGIIHTTEEASSAEQMQLTSMEMTTPSVTSGFTTAFHSPSCPTNMVFMNCTCQATCEDPNRMNGCHSNCTGSKQCICPEGFYMMGEDCVPLEECGCFFETGSIIREGDVQLVFDCTQLCSCNNGILSCYNYQCGSNAACDNRNDSLQCYCDDGYHTDGVSCVRLTDCKDVYDAGLVEEDVYTIFPSQWPGLPFQVYCKGGWTRRMDGSEDFYRYWADYKEGFGELRREMWLGLEKLYYLTNQGFNKLKISLVSDGTPYEMNHSYFKIDSEGNNYALLEVGNYSGNGGFDLMAYHYSQQFTTKDRDNDRHDRNCAVLDYGAWWYNQCYSINLNGKYGDPPATGICFFNGGNGIYFCNISATEMSITHITPSQR